VATMRMGPVVGGLPAPTWVGKFPERRQFFDEKGAGSLAKTVRAVNPGREYSKECRKVQSALHEHNERTG
jgi:hypothetical protein